MRVEALASAASSPEGDRRSFGERAQQARRRAGSLAFCRTLLEALKARPRRPPARPETALSPPRNSILTSKRSLRPVNGGPRQTPIFWPLKKHDKGEFAFLVPGRPLDLPSAPPFDPDANGGVDLPLYRGEAQRAVLWTQRSKQAACTLGKKKTIQVVIIGSSWGLANQPRSCSFEYHMLSDRLMPVIYSRGVPRPTPFASLAAALKEATSAATAPIKQALKADAGIDRLDQGTSRRSRGSAGDRPGRRADHHEQQGEGSWRKIFSSYLPMPSMEAVEQVVLTVGESARSCGAIAAEGSLASSAVPRIANDARRTAPGYRGTGCGEGH